MKSALAAALASSFFSFTAHAAIVIDLFNDAGLTAAASGFTVGTDITAGSMVGGERVMQAVWLSGGGNVNVEVDRLGNGTYELTTDPGTLGFSQVVFEGVAFAGLGGIDVTDGGVLDTIGMRVLGIDTDTLVTAQMRDTDGDTATLLKLIPSTLSTPDAVRFRFADMSQGPGTFDFTAVDRIGFTIEPQAAGSMLQLEATLILDAVPIPAMGWPGVALLGVLLTGAGASATNFRATGPVPTEADGA